jgi:hypothetical protein
MAMAFEAVGGERSAFGKNQQAMEINQRSEFT